MTRSAPTYFPLSVFVDVYSSRKGGDSLYLQGNVAGKGTHLAFVKLSMEELGSLGHAVF